jgi:hypothetical protein
MYNFNCKKINAAKVKMSPGHAVVRHLEEGGLDPGHGEGDGLDGVVEDPEGASELDGPHVANVLRKKRQALRG